MTRLAYRFHDGGRLHAGFGSRFTKDCVVRAVAIVTGAPYGDVWEAANRIKREQGKQSPDKGFPTRSIKTLLVQFAERVECVQPYSITVKDRVTTEPRRVGLAAENLPPRSRCLVLVRSHALAVIDGVVYDTWNPANTARRRIQSYYIVTQKKEYQT